MTRLFSDARAAFVVDTAPPDLRWGPTFQPWLDLPTLRLDDAGKKAAQRHIADYRAGRARRDFEP